MTREDVDSRRVREFLHELGRSARSEAVCYLAGGATAVLYGWRETTIDVDVRIEPDDDDVLRVIPALKERLRVNVELTSPLDFIPLPAGWRDRSPFVAREGSLTIRHFDLYSQALAKLARNHERDQHDVRAMLDRGYVDREELRERFHEIVPELFRAPQIEPAAFQRNVEHALSRG